MVGFEGRAGRSGRRRKPKVTPEGSRKVGRRRKSKIGRKAMPEGATIDESRMLGSWAEPEGWQSAKVGGHLEGEAGRLAAGESRRLAGRHSRRVGQKRKRMVGTTAQSEDRPKAQADGWHNGLIGDIDQRCKPMVGATVGLEDRLKAKAGERSED